MFCIRCGTELSGVCERCPTCGADLVGEGQAGAMEPWAAQELEEYDFEDLYDGAGYEWRMAPAWVAKNTAEVAAARGLLEAAGIPVEVRASAPSMPEVGVVVGGIEILVPEPTLDYAKELLKSAELNAPSRSPEDMLIEDMELGTAIKSLGMLALLVGAAAVGLRILKARLMGASDV